MLSQSRTSLIVPSRRELADRDSRGRFIDMIHFYESNENFITNSQRSVGPDDVLVRRKQLAADFDIGERFVGNRAGVSWSSHPTDDRQENPEIADTGSGDALAVQKDFEGGHGRRRTT